MMATRNRGWVWATALLAALAFALAACGEEDGPTGGDGGDRGIAAFDDLGDGHIVAVQDGTTGQQWAEDNLESKGVQIRSFPEGPDGYTALEACQVDAVVNDESTAVAEVANRSDLEVVDTVDTGENYGIAIDPENEELLAAVNGALTEIIDDGTYEQIFDRYADLPPGGAVGESAGAAAPEDFSTIEEGVLLVGSDIPYPPFEYREGGELTGFDIDLMTEIATRLELEVEFKDTDFDTIFTQLAAGRYDAVIAASTITPAREKQVNFSDPYFRSQQSLTVNPTC